MIKLFIKDSLIYSLPSLFSRGIGIFLLPIYTRISSKEELGALDLFLIFGNVMILIVSLEIIQGIARFTPEIKNLSMKMRYFASGLIFTFIMYSLCIFIAFIFSFELNMFITQSETFLSAFKLTLLYIFFNGFFYFFQTILRFEGKSMHYSYLSFLYASMNLFFTIIFGIFLKFGLIAIILAMTISALLCALVGLFLVKDIIFAKPEFRILKKLLTFSLPLVPSGLFAILGLYVDRLMINEMMTLDDVGLYSVGIRIASITGLIMIGFQLSLTPLVYKNYKLKETPKDLANIFRIFVVIAIIYFVSFSIFASEIIVLLTTQDFYGIKVFMPFLVLSFMFSQMYVFMPGIAIKKKTYLILMINIFVFIINIVLNLILIPYYGILGAALSSALSYFICFIGYVYFSQKYYFVPHNILNYLINFSLSVLLVFAYYKFFDFTFMENILGRVLFILLVLVFIFLFKLIRFNDLQGIKNIIFDHKR